MSRSSRNISGGDKGFMNGVLMLSLSTLIVKIIGLAFKIPMLSFLGTEGMGYFNSAYEIYAILCVMSTAGLPVALSMLISSARARKDALEVERIYKRARRVFLWLGFIGTVIMLCLAEQISSLIGNPDARLSIMAIAPALTFICVASAIRGYCQGFEQMTPTAVSQLLEALLKLTIGVLLAAYAVKKGYALPIVAAFSVLGVTLGTLASMIYLIAARRSGKYRLYCAEINAGSVGGEKKRGGLLAIALPITLGSAVIGLSRIIDMAFIIRRLQDIGASTTEANSIYGAYTTLAIPVFSLIPALIAPVSMALVPQLSNYIAANDPIGRSRVVERSVRMTVLLAMPASFALAVFSRPILELLFAGQSYAIDVSAPLLAMLGASVLFSCLMTTCNAILQSYRRVYLPVIAMSIGILVKLVASYLLIGEARIGVMGAPIGSLLCNITAVAFEIYFMGYYPDCRISVRRTLILPLIASVISVGMAAAVYVFVQDKVTDLVSLALAGAAALVIYAAISFLMGSIDVEDIELLPMGERILAYITKRKDKRKNIGGSK